MIDITAIPGIVAIICVIALAIDDLCMIKDRSVSGPRWWQR